MAKIKRVKKIVRDLKKASDKYYNTGLITISDEEYDSLEEKLRSLDPKNEFLKKIGSKVSGEKFKHLNPMLSMSKAKTIQEIEKWICKIGLQGSRFIIEPKIDGISCSCHYRNGYLEKIVTRGDGLVGLVITHISLYMDTIPKKINNADTIEVRGELYIPKTNYLKTGNVSLRNICSGIINRKDNFEDLKNVKFLAYQLIGIDINTEKQVLNKLKLSGFNVVDYHIAQGEYEIDSIRDYFNLYMDSLRDNWRYETDGLVVIVDDKKKHEELDSKWEVNKYHHYNIALKPPSQGALTKAIRVVWQMSRHGNNIPVVEFEPVFICGVNISRATLDNYENAVEKLRVNPGDKLYIERANDVIPYVSRNIDADDGKRIKYPKKCPHCNKRLLRVGVHIKCVNPGCPEIAIQKISFWVKQSNIDGISSQTVRKLYDEKVISSIGDLYSLKKENLISLDGIQEKRADKIISEIHNSKKMSCKKFIAMLGIPLVQERSVSKLKINSIQDFIDFKHEDYVISKNIVEWKKNKENRALFNELIKVLEIEEGVENKGGKKICLTGKWDKSRKELEDKANEMGYSVVNNVSKSIDLLVCDNIDGGGKKMTSALKYGIDVVLYEDFFNQEVN